MIELLRALEQKWRERSRMRCYADPARSVYETSADELSAILRDHSGEARIAEVAETGALHALSLTLKNRIAREVSESHDDRLERPVMIMLSTLCTWSRIIQATLSNPNPTEASGSRSISTNLQIAFDYFDQRIAQEGTAPYSHWQTIRSEFLDLRNAQREPDAAMWRAIETAPKDGSNIWVADTNNMRVAFWSNSPDDEYGQDNLRWVDFFKAYHTRLGTLEFTPTHWQPLPTALGIV